MALTDIAIRRARTRDKAYKLYDELGLFLIVAPSGSRLWRMRFKRHGIEKKLSFGSYPDVSLRDARKLRDDARDLLAEGKDPVLERQREKLRSEALAENTFTRIANEYCSARRRPGQGMTKWALQLAPHVFVRPGELRHARWDEIDFDAAVWTIPAEKMKMRKPHHAPLSTRSIAICWRSGRSPGPTAMACTLQRRTPQIGLFHQ
ncbi:tyrosine-type recombinase/integrase [Sphingomonas hengshuiensis]|uniref:tyrosine-type recombinase/integrase n=1 Tax=Sphingomonas hengshuiensis TaxID=1609977 RepID=UPI000AFA5022|nr:integrase arm-type DNA-binding domain-containing protein [Sphingomonas hengshuiensis]